MEIKDFTEIKLSKKCLTKSNRVCKEVASKVICSDKYHGHVGKCFLPHVNKEIVFIAIKRRKQRR